MLAILTNMKKFDLPLWADSVFIFTVLSILFLVFFRFSMPLPLAIICSIATGLCGSTLFFFIYKKHRTKKHYSKAEKENMEKLGFHLAITTLDENIAILMQALTEKAKIEEKELPILENNSIFYDDKQYICNFQFEKITADILSPYIRGETNKIIFLGLDFTAEAKKLANSFNLKLFNLIKIYDFLKEYNALPDKFVEAPNQKKKFLQNVQLRFSKKAAKGYLFSGSFLLLFSMITIFPLYYIVFGSILLAVAVFLRFFGKSEH